MYLAVESGHVPAALPAATSREKSRSRCRRRAQWRCVWRTVDSTERLRRRSNIYSSDVQKGAAIPRRHVPLTTVQTPARSWTPPSLLHLILSRLDLFVSDPWWICTKCWLILCSFFLSLLLFSPRRQRLLLFRTTAPCMPAVHRRRLAIPLITSSPARRLCRRSRIWLLVSTLLRRHPRRPLCLSRQARRLTET